MQDTSAGKTPRVYQVRGCQDCPTSFTPTGSKQVRCPDCQGTRDEESARATHERKMAKRKADRATARDNAPECSVGGCKAKLRCNNTTGRCSEHRYIGEGMGACGTCGTPIRCDNKTGFCERHKSATSRVPGRVCLGEACDQTLRVDNESGYCGRHAGQSENVQLYRAAVAARLHAEARARYEARAKCSVKGCKNRIRSDNTTGRCAPHIYIPANMPECALGGCETRIRTDNTTGRCQKHRATFWVAPECAECGKTLHTDNETGYCPEHRGLSEQRKAYDRAYYQSRKAEFQEYARLWRLANGDDHRAAVRAWNAANRAARQAMHARRRTRAKVNMTATDRLRSVARREEIADDPCFYCGTPETSDTDHYFPLAKDGTDHWWNLVRACDPCNSRKNAKCGTRFMLLTGTWQAPPLPAS